MWQALSSVGVSNNLHSKSLADQQRLVNDEESRTILQKAKHFSASIIGVSDRRSTFSECTNTNTLGLDFDFDALLLSSQAYRSAHRSNLRQLTTTSRAPGPISPSRSSVQQRPIALLQDPLEGIFSALESSDSDLPLSHNGSDPNHHNESPSSEIDQDAEQHYSLPVISSDRIGDPCQPSSASQESVIAPIPGGEAVGIASFSFKSPREKGAALMVPSTSSTPANAMFTPRIALLRLLGKYRHARTTDYAEDASGTWGPLAAKPNTEPPDSTRTSLRQPEIKVVLVGASQSGKTTLHKAMKNYWRGGFNLEERTEWVVLLRANTIQSIRYILEEMESFKIPLQHEENGSHAQYIFLHPTHFKPDDKYPEGLEEVAIAVTQLWADAGVQEAFRRRQEYWLMDNVSYFANNAQQLFTRGYIPSQEDILRCRLRTIGITETRIDLGEVIVRLMDMGGVRSERKKWIHAFDNMDSVVFTVDTTSYCRRLIEDEEGNSMSESFCLWEAIANSRYFTEVNFFLMFTKVDLLPETFELSPITQYFPQLQATVDSCGDMDQLIDSYLAFLKGGFLSLMESEEARRRTQVVFADLVQIDDKNPAGSVLESLKARTLGQV